MNIWNWKPKVFDQSSTVNLIKLMENWCEKRNWPLKTFFWFVFVICHITLDCFLTLMFKTCKMTKVKNNKRIMMNFIYAACPNQKKKCNRNWRTFGVMIYPWWRALFQKSYKNNVFSWLGKRCWSPKLSNGGPKSMKIVEKSIKIEPWGFLETKVNLLFPHGAQMEPHGAKLEPKLSSKLVEIGLNLISKSQVRNAAIGHAWVKKIAKNREEIQFLTALWLTLDKKFGYDT